MLGFLAILSCSFPADWSSPESLQVSWRKLPRPSWQSKGTLYLECQRDTELTCCLCIDHVRIVKRLATCLPSSLRLWRCWGHALYPQSALRAQRHCSHLLASLSSWVPQSSLSQWVLDQITYLLKCCPTREFSGQQASLPFLLSPSGLWGAALGAVLTTRVSALLTQSLSLVSCDLFRSILSHAKVVYNFNPRTQEVDAGGSLNLKPP